MMEYIIIGLSAIAFLLFFSGLLSYLLSKYLHTTDTFEDKIAMLASVGLFFLAVVLTGVFSG